MWLVGLWGPAAYFLLSRKGFGGLIVAILGPLILFVVAFLVLAVIFVIRQFRSGKRLTSADAGTIGGFFLQVFPLLMTVALGIYLRSWLVAIGYIALYIAVMVIVLLLQMQPYRVHLLIELARSVFRALWRSMALLLVLIPLLFVIVVLSVFSQELWQALGTLSLSRLVGGALCLVVPALILLLASLDREAAAIVGQFPDKSQIIENAENTLYIKIRLRKGLIGEEEWDRLKSQLEWRGTTRLAERLLPMLHKKVKRWLALLLGLTSLALVASFFVYFYVFFSVILSPSLIEMWTGIQLNAMIVPIGFFGYHWEFELPTTAVAIAKVSLVLAVFIAVMSIVYALTDETIKRIFTEWLNQKASSWLAVSSLYLCAVSPDYQIWEYFVRDKNKGIANVSIVVPRGLSGELVKKACEHVESRLEEYRNLIVITAFEENPERPVYKLGMPGNRWRLLHNKVKGIRVFESIPLVLDELRYQHFLGRNSLREGVEIEDEWFGNTPKGMALAKSVWEADADHEWVLHPYVFESDAILSFEISLAKRRAKSDQYRQYVRELLTLTRQMIPDAKNILVELSFRDTVETLARLNWSKELPYAEYKDELIGESKIEKPSAWD
jgi:hypothetical protein